MYNLLTKHGQTFALGLGLLVIIVYLITVFTGISSSGYEMSTDLNALDAEEKAAIGFFNPSIILTIVLIVVAAILAFVVFGALNIIKFPTESIKFVIGFVALLIVFLICYFTSSTDAVGRLNELISKRHLSDNVVKFISGGILTTLLLTVGAMALIVYSEVRNAFK